MATHSSILAWRIPWTEKPGGLQFMGSRRVRTGLERLGTHTCTHLEPYVKFYSRTDFCYQKTNGFLALQNLSLLLRKKEAIPLTLRQLPIDYYLSLPSR